MSAGNAEFSSLEKTSNNYEYETHTFLKMKLVLSNVLWYVDVRDLKNCRLVNSLWKNEATPIIRRYSVVKFINRRQCPMGRKNSEEPVLLKLSRYLIEMSNFGQENFIFLNDFTTKIPTESLKDFFRKLGSQIKWLRLSFILNTPADINTLADIIDNSANLTTLKLQLGIYLNREILNGLNALRLTRLANVRNLLFEINVHEEIDEIIELDDEVTKNDMIFPISNFIVRLVPKPESLVIKCYKEVNVEILQQYSNKIRWENLKISDVRLFSTPNSSSKPLEILCKWPTPLKKLWLLTVPESSDVYYQALLNKHAPTLEELKLCFVLLKKSDEIVMPIFPKLIKLVIKNNWDGCPSEAEFRFDFSFKRHFPKLNMESDKIEKIFSDLRSPPQWPFGNSVKLESDDLQNNHIG